jgi:hypothetical protein
VGSISENQSTTPVKPGSATSSNLAELGIPAGKAALIEEAASLFGHLVEDARATTEVAEAWSVKGCTISVGTNTSVSCTFGP